MQRTHFGQHGAECFGCKIQTVSIAPSATPSRHPGAARAKAGDKQLAKDLDAYKRMRQAGLEPKSTQGAARVEAVATSEYEVVSGQLGPDMAKGRDVDHGGAEWVRRAEEAYQTVKRGEVIEAVT